jgi:hypothetical protein
MKDTSITFPPTNSLGISDARINKSTVNSSPKKYATPDSVAPSPTQGKYSNPEEREKLISKLLAEHRSKSNNSEPSSIYFGDEDANESSSEINYSSSSSNINRLHESYSFKDNSLFFASDFAHGTQSQGQSWIGSHSSNDLEFGDSTLRARHDSLRISRGPEKAIDKGGTRRTSAVANNRERSTSRGKEKSSKGSRSISRERRATSTSRERRARGTSKERRIFHRDRSASNERRLPREAWATSFDNTKENYEAERRTSASSPDYIAEAEAFIKSTTATIAEVRASLSSSSDFNKQGKDNQKHQKMIEDLMARDNERKKEWKYLKSKETIEKEYDKEFQNKYTFHPTLVTSNKGSDSISTKRRPDISTRIEEMRISREKSLLEREKQRR